jgi:peptidoglycan DL-endopeptidase RipA
MSEGIKIKSDLIELKTVKATEIFEENGTESILKKVKAEVSKSTVDINDEESRAAAKSLSRKISSLKTEIDNIGKAYVGVLKQKTDAIDEERKRFRDQMDAWRDEVKKPVTDWEEAEQARIDERKARLESMKALAVVPVGSSSKDITDRMRQLMALYQFDWQDFMPLADETKASVESDLQKNLDFIKMVEEEQEKLQKLQKEQAEKERKEREEKIAKDAAEKAKRDAEEKAQKDKDAADQKLKEETERAARAEQEAADARKREQEAKDKAAKDAQEAAERAAQAERDRIAAEERQKREEADARERDKQHRKKINNEALDAILAHEDVIAAKLTKEMAIAVLTAIAQKKVPHVTIAY